MVVDADGLNALSENPSSLTSAAGPRILTPHVGEFRRLANKPSMNAEDCQTEAKRFAWDHQCIVVMKGHRTLVTDGNREFNNETGNPGMATGGSGDVLTGVILGLLGQGLAAWEAAVLGVYLHGLAGDLARDRVGEASLVASDIKDHLAAALLATNETGHRSAE